MIALLAALAAAAPADLVVEGLGKGPLTVTPDAFAKLPPAQVSIEAHGQALACSGVMLRDLLAAAGAPSGEKLRGPALTGTVTAVARDGYRVTFSLGEIDLSLGKIPVLVANRCNGSALGEDGPYRLLVGGETRSARSARMLDRLVVSMPDGGAAPAHEHGTAQTHPRQKN